MPPTVLCAATSQYAYQVVARQVPRCAAARSYGSLMEPHLWALLHKDGGSNRRRRREKKDRGSSSNKPSYRFVDKIRVRVVGGEGGRGSLSAESLVRRKMRPDGGHGGNGGSVILLADPNEQTLHLNRPVLRAEKGANGSGKQKHGRNGRNRIIRVPCGVVVRKISSPHDDHLYGYDGYDEDFMEDFEIEGEEYDDEEHDDDDDDFLVSGDDLSEEDYSESAEGGGLEDDTDYHSGEEGEAGYLADLDKPGSHVVVARGGRGGTGSMIYASRHGPVPRDGTVQRKARPKPPEVTLLELELKLIADVGLVGFPNAGKSSLLRAMSRATPAVAPYPFTTLHPLLGVVEYRDGMKIRVADIPGLIAGASQGRGKGIDFLRHIERTKALCYMLDAAGTEGRDPHEDLRILVDELSTYADGTLMDRDALVVANKVDLIEPDRLEDLLMSLQETADSLGIERFGSVAGISAGVSGQGLGTLSKDLRSIVEQFESGGGISAQTGEV